MKVSNTAPINVNTGDSDGKSTQVEFATRQLGMADASKTQALKEMKTLEQDQAEQRLIIDVMLKIHNAKADNPAATTTTLDTMVVDYLRKNNIIPGPSQADIEKIDKLLEEIEKKMKEAKEKGVPVHLDASLAKQFEDEYRGKLYIPDTAIPHLTEEKGFTEEQLAEMVKSMRPFVDLSYHYNVKDMDTLIKLLQGRLDAVGTNSQQALVTAQDAVGKYNSYIGGASRVIQQSN